MGDGYRLCRNVRTDALVRDSFNALAQRVFGLDFGGWYAAGGWGPLYIPYALLDGDRVVSNVSVNVMRFELADGQKTYLQLGTVMTDPGYRGRGLNRRLMETVLADWRAKVDGIYLFANDQVCGYYPRFGFSAAVQTEYYLPASRRQPASPYRLERVDLAMPEWETGFYAALRQPNPNDGFFMSENAGLYRFWLGAEYGACVYYLPELGAYAIATQNGPTLQLHQMVGGERADPGRLACSFGVQAEELVFGYTPAERAALCTRPCREEDTTLFVLGEDLKRIERDRLRFPALSYA